MKKYTILGAGLSGLSCSYHLGHENCILFEGKSYAGGHIYSRTKEGFTWDEGPHVSFTDNLYVRGLFEQSVDGAVLDFPVIVSNYYKGSWIPHPAQSNLFATPPDIKKKCLDDFLIARSLQFNSHPKNYGEWLERAFGKTFSEIFPSAYTRKYWTVEPARLDIDWIGNRVFYPDLEAVVNGADREPINSSHYIKTVRYPNAGGYIAFAKKLMQNSDIAFNHKVGGIDLKNKLIYFSNGKTHKYENLISTIPLPELVYLSNAPSHIKEAADKLNCSSVLLVNITANHPAKKPYHWMYVYDEDKYSTRINTIELLSPENAPTGKTGVQVEVYESNYKKLDLSHREIATIVSDELIEMGLIDSVETLHTYYIPYANVIFDHDRKHNQDLILSWLEQYGLKRESEDLEPMTSWVEGNHSSKGSLILAGRFGEWKYYWTDDCVLRGLFISRCADLA